MDSVTRVLRSSTFTRRPFGPPANLGDLSDSSASTSGVLDLADAASTSSQLRPMTSAIEFQRLSAFPVKCLSPPETVPGAIAVG